MIRTLMIRTLCSCLAVAALFAAQPLAQAPEPKAPASRPATLINLNTATVTDLQELPGIGPKVAQRIVEYRQKKGPFKKIEELMNVQGIGEKSFLKIRSQITVAAKPEPAGQQ